MTETLSKAPPADEADDDGHAGEDDHGAGGWTQRGLLGEIDQAEHRGARKQPEAKAERRAERPAAFPLPGPSPRSPQPRGWRRRR